MPRRFHTTWPMRWNLTSVECQLSWLVNDNEKSDKIFDLFLILLFDKQIDKEMQSAETKQKLNPLDHAVIFRRYFFFLEITWIQFMVLFFSFHSPISGTRTHDTQSIGQFIIVNPICMTVNRLSWPGLVNQWRSNGADLLFWTRSTGTAIQMDGLLASNQRPNCKYVYFYFWRFQINIGKSCCFSFVTTISSFWLSLRCARLTANSARTRRATKSKRFVQNEIRRWHKIWIVVSISCQ